MRCSPYVWIFIFTSTLGLNGVASADNTAAVNCSTLCLDALTTVTSYLSAQASKLSGKCNSAADSKRTTLLGDGNSEIASAVRRIEGRLMKCGLNSDPLRYFRCLQNTMDEVPGLLDDIVRKSTQLIADHAEELIQIEKEETDCLDAVDLKSKLAYDQAFEEYRECQSTASDCSGSLTTSPSIISSSSSSKSSSLSASSISTVSTASSTLSFSSSTSTTLPTKEESSLVAPEGEQGIQPRSTDGSDTIVIVIVASVVLVFILLIATYLYRKKARRHCRFQLKTSS